MLPLPFCRPDLRRDIFVNGESAAHRVIGDDRNGIHFEMNDLAISPPPLHRLLRVLPTQRQFRQLITFFRFHSCPEDVTQVAVNEFAGFVEEQLAKSFVGQFDAPMRVENNNA